MSLDRQAPARNGTKPPRKAKKKTGTAMIVAPNAGDLAKFAPLIAPSRMHVNVLELSERPQNISFKDIVMRQLGDLTGYTVLGTDVLVATYIKPRKTAGGIIIPDKGAEEDRYQGKIGLVIKLGEAAFQFDGQYAYKGTIPKAGDFVAFHTSDTREIGILGFSCRTVDSQLVRMIVPDPDAIF